MTQNQSNSTNCPGCTNEFCEATHLLLSSNFGVNPKDNNEKPVCLGMYSPQTPLAKDEPTVKHQNEIHTGKKRKRNAEVVSSNDILDECNDMPRKKVFLSFGIDQILSKEYKGGNSISLENTDSGYTTGSLVCSSLDDQRIQAIMLDSQIPECNQDASNETCIEVNPLQSDCQNSLTVETESKVTRRSIRKKKRTKFTDFQRYYLKKLYRKAEYPEHHEIEKIARDLNLTMTNIKVWFQNRRSRKKKAAEQSDNSDNDTQPIFINPKTFCHMPIITDNPLMHQASIQFQQLMNQSRIFQIPYPPPPHRPMYCTSTPAKPQQKNEQSQKQLFRPYLPSSEDELRNISDSDEN